MIHCCVKELAKKNRGLNLMLEREKTKVTSTTPTHISTHCQVLLFWQLSSSLKIMVLQVSKLEKELATTAASK